MKYIKTLRIDIDKKNFEVIPSVQYDSNTRYLHIYLLNNSLAFDITGCSVKISGTKPDGTVIFNNCTIINAKEGFIEVELTGQMNAVPGTVKCELKLYDGNGVLSTKQFKIEVSASITSKEITSSNEFKALTDAVNEIQNIDNRFKEVDSQIKDIANKGTTVEVLERVTKEEIDRQIADGTMANLTIADDSITKQKIKYNIDPLDIDGTVITNYFNIENLDITYGKYYGTDGNINNNDNYCYFKTVVQGGKSYTKNKAFNLGVIYSEILTDLSGNFISKIDRKFDFTTPSEPRLMYHIISMSKVNATKEKLSNFMIIEGTEQPSMYSKFKAKINWLNINKEQISDFKIENKDIDINSINGENLGEKIPLYLFDGIECTNYFDADYNILNSKQYTAVPSYYYTDWNYLPSGEYTVSNAYQIYLKGKAGEKTITGNTIGKPVEFALDSGYTHYRLLYNCNKNGVINVENFRDITIIKGKGTPQKATPKKYILENFDRIQLDYYATHWNGKIYISMGDSITRGYAPGSPSDGIIDGSQIEEPYAKYISNKLNMNLLNLGVDGATVKTAIQNDHIGRFGDVVPDLVTIAYGANDMSFTQLGTIDDEYTTLDSITFYSGFKKIVKDIQTQYPNCTIVIIGNPNTTTRSNDMLTKYNQAKKEIADLYNVLYVDLRRLTPFNLNNNACVSEFQLDNIHPNAKAHQLIGSRLTGFISSI